MQPEQWSAGLNLRDKDACPCFAASVCKSNQHALIAQVAAKSSKRTYGPYKACQPWGGCQTWFSPLSACGSSPATSLAQKTLWSMLHPCQAWLCQTTIPSNVQAWFATAIKLQAALITYNNCQACSPWQHLSNHKMTACTEVAHHNSVHLARVRCLMKWCCSLSSAAPPLLLHEVHELRALSLAGLVFFLILFFLFFPSCVRPTRLTVSDEDKRAAADMCM